MTTDELIDQLADGLNMTYGAPNVVKVGEILYRAEMRPDCAAIDNLRDHGGVWGDTGWTRGNSYGTVRPEWATGNAEILFRDRDDAVWWEPPADVPRSSPHFRELRQNVRDLLEYGFSSVTVERCEGTDAYGRPIVVDVAELYRIEPYADDDYLRSVVADLVAELMP